VARLEEALRVAERDDHSFARAMAHEQMARLFEHRDEPAPALAHAVRAIELGEEYGFPYRIASGAVLRGWARAMLGEAKDGLEDIDRGLAGCRTLGAIIEYPYFLALRAKALHAAGDAAAGLAVLDEALAQARERQGFFYEADILRLMGRLRQPADEAGAEEAFLAALAVARYQGAIAPETRAAVDLARLWLQQGRPDAATSLLAELDPPLIERASSPATIEAVELLAGVAGTAAFAVMPAPQGRAPT